MRNIITCITEKRDVLFIILLVSYTFCWNRAEYKDFNQLLLY